MFLLVRSLVQKAVAPSWLLTIPDFTKEVYTVLHSSRLYPVRILLNAGKTATALFFPSLFKLNKH